MILGLRHTGIVVSDLEAALRFYVGLLGFTISKRAEESGEHMDKMLGVNGARVTTVKLSSPDGGMIELLQFHGSMNVAWHRRLSDFGITHIALTVSDLSEAFDRLFEAGVDFVSEPVTSGACRVAFAMDPDGNYVELAQELH